MDQIKVSICASANRVMWWERFLNSLRGNNISYEVIFSGDVSPQFDLKKYPEFKYIPSTVKPAQAYEICFRAAKGELIHWSADDADYNHPTRNCPNAIEIAYNHYKEFEQKYGDYKTVIAMRPIEDGGDVYKFHHYFGGWEETPVMAPFGLINRKWFVEELGGYDKRFISGQSENDVVMRAIENGGRVEICLDSFVYVHHRQVHPRNPSTGKEDNKFRKWYNEDRKVLENCWVIGGYGSYEKNIHSAKLSSHRLSPVEKFSDEDITTITQGQKGHWL